MNEYRKKYNLENKDKISQQHKEHYLKNQETHKNRMKLWRENNPEKSKEIIKNWELNNFEKNKEYHKNYDKIQKPKWFKFNYDNNIEFKLIQNLRTRINKELKSKKIDKTKKLLGCSIQEYKQYLEELFKPEMTWDNYGKVWEIDHIKPCSNFDLTKLEEQQKCFHYTNNQPLFKTTEIAKEFGYLNEIGNRNKSNKLIN